MSTDKVLQKKRLIFLVIALRIMYWVMLTHLLVYIIGIMRVSKPIGLGVCYNTGTSLITLIAFMKGARKKMRVNVISTKHQYKGKDGSDKVGLNFYLVLDNGKTIAIQPSFAQGYTQLSLIATPYEPKKEVKNNAD